ncbi:MAG TPA: acetate--CoA ligase family protein [Candidatus Bathyarchaeia archaeon]|nr:acetate--CoA ligase family protein [Candidatus Bathyarchaeia archaeon]
MPAGSIIAKALLQNRTVLLEPEAKQICRAYGLSVPKSKLAINMYQAARFAEKIGFPIVMKIVSPDILHKTEAGGVLLDLSTKKDDKNGFSKIVSNAKAFRKTARIYGILVEHMARAGLEVIIGGTRDPQFGPVVMFGLGGIFTEVLKDVTFGLVPIRKSEAHEMIRGIRAYRALTGFRYRLPVNEPAIASAMVQVSKIMNENQQIGQIDLNPVMAYSRGCSVVDARILLASAHKTERELKKNDGSDISGKKTNRSANR